MSRYEDYHEVSKAYDQTRGPVGFEILLECLGAGERPLAECRLLDAGCGTGAFSQALLPHVAHIDAVDLNEGMLSVARAKLAIAEGEGRIAFHHAGIAELPLPDESVDAVTINQVLHHLEDGTDEAWSVHAAVIAEFHRVLRPGGVLVINSCTHEQLRKGFCYYGLIPGALEECVRRHMPADRLLKMLGDSGFRPGAPRPVLDPPMQGDAWYDPDGPLSDSWRKGDSFWALATEEQLAATEARVRDMQEAGKLEAWFHEADAPRKQIGQLTFFPAVRE